MCLEDVNRISIQNLDKFLILQVLKLFLRNSMWYELFMYILKESCARGALSPHSFFFQLKPEHLSSSGKVTG